MTVHFELSKDDMKNIYPDAFYLMPSSRKSKNADFLFAFLITIIALDLIADFPFVMNLMIAMVLGILIYFFASRWILKFVTLFMIWKYKNSFPRRYQLDLHDNYFIYTDLDNETNHGKIAWDSIEEGKEFMDMKKRNKSLFKIVIGFLFIYFILSFFIPFSTSYFGWVEVTDKHIDNSIYYIDAVLEGENIQIKIEENEEFIFENKDTETTTTTINEVWNLIEQDEKYFVSIYTNILKSSYKLEKLYED